MKKYLIGITFILLLLFGQSAFAWQFCFDVQCPDCTSYSPQQFRIDYDPESAMITGIVQADDDSWGRAVAGMVVGTHAYLSRFARSNGSQYLYDIDIVSMTGVRHDVRYDTAIGADYSVKSDRQTVLVLVECP